MKRFLILVLVLPGIAFAQATLTFSTNAPAPGSCDVFNFAGAVRDGVNVYTNSSGTLDGTANDAFTYVASDRVDQGQTFTTGNAPGGYLLNSIWVRQVGYVSNGLAGNTGGGFNGTWWDSTAGGTLAIRITDPAFAGTTNFVLRRETCPLTGNEANNPGSGNSTNGTGRWLRFVLSIPVPLSAGRTYGFDLASTGSTNRYFEWLGTASNVLAGGTAYNGGTTGQGGGPDNALNPLSGTRVFLAQMSSPSIPVVSWQTNADGMTLQMDPGQLRLQVFSPGTVRVAYSLTNSFPTNSLAVVATPTNSGWMAVQDARGIGLDTPLLQVRVNPDTGAATFYDTNGIVILGEAAVGGKSLTPATVSGFSTLRSQQRYTISPTEAIYGLGEHASGLMNYRGSSVHLQNVNPSEGSVPVLVSSRGYGIFWDNPAISDVSVAQGNPTNLTWTSEAAGAVDYYFMYGPALDDVVGAYRNLTGNPPMFGRWAWGLWQCRNHYETQAEVLNVAATYRSLGWPLDGVIQDWQYWTPNPWGSHLFDASRYPNVAQMMQTLHNENAHLIVSVWARFDTNIANAVSLASVNGLYTNVLANLWPVGYGQWYDPFNPAARQVYWNGIATNLFSRGIDGWWFDASEPELSGNWGEFRAFNTAAGSGASVFNAYPLMHTTSAYAGQRATHPAKRVFILTRSAWAGQQRNAAVTWSGDISGSFAVLAQQIPAGLNFSLSGIPYWNTDTGGFNDNSPGNSSYAELFTRWFQFSTFCPMLRIHGNNDKAIYNFPAVTQTNLVSFDRLRYNLLPYIYSVSWQVTSAGYTMMRPLVMDFQPDTNVFNITDQYMFGPALMPCPVTVAGATNRTVYLPALNNAEGPAGATWYDFWTGTTNAGGQTITAAAPIDKLPVFVRAGSILPYGPAVQYAMQSCDPTELRVYGGADGAFTLYEDEGDNYDYEAGRYATIPMVWNEASKTLTIGARQGGFPGMLTNRTFRVVCVANGHGTGVVNSATADAVLSYDGTAMVLSCVPALVPAGLTAIAISNQISLAWSPVAGADSYNIRRSTTSGGPYTTIMGVSATSGLDTNVVAGARYYYVVNAMSGGTQGLDSAEATAAVPSSFWDWAARPVMGWNSWDFYGTSINEACAKAQADYMAAHLLSRGWSLVTVDIQWYQPTATGFNYIADAALAMDQWGRLTPATNRFPSAVNGAGFKPLADYVHAKGLKFGIHMMRGIPRQAVSRNTPVLGTTNTASQIADMASTCSWNSDMYGVDMTKPGAQAYYDSLMALVASWGVDFIKIDDLSRPYHVREIEAIRAAIDKTGRPIVFSTSPGATPVGMGAHVMQNANQWRISDDFWDSWSALYAQFQRLYDWTPYRGQGHFPDADMLPLGKVSGGSTNATGRSTYFTTNEQYTLMSLWAIARSPLIHGGDMTQMDGFTLSLMTNDEVLAVNQRSSHNRQLFRRGDGIAWTADAEDGTNRYLAVFNTTGAATNVSVSLSALGYTGACSIRSLWDGAELGPFSGTFSPSVASHGGMLYRLSGAFIPTPWITRAVAGDNQVALEWERIAAADSFNVKRALAATGTYQAIATGVTNAFFTDSTPRNGVTYYYTVSATMGGQESPDSGTCAATPAGTPGAVSWNLDSYGTVTGRCVAGVVAATNWNNSYPDDPVTGLKDVNGWPTSVAIVYNRYNDAHIQGSHPGADADGTWNRELLNGYLNSGTSQVPIASAVSISGIPFTFYDLYVYFSSDTAGHPGTVTDGSATFSFTTMGASSISGMNAAFVRSSDAGTRYPAANFAVFAGSSESNKIIHCEIPLWGGIAGFQIVPRTNAPAPVGIQAMAGSWRVLLTWANYNGATNYTVKRATTSGGPYTPVAAVAGTSYEDTGVAAGATYYYVLTATLPAVGETPASVEVAALVGATLQVCLPFDATSGVTAADATGNGWNGTLANGASWAPGYISNAVTLNGSNQYVSLPSGVVSNLGAFSITAWVNLKARPTWSRIFDFGSGTSNYMFLTPASDGGKLRFAITTNSYSSEQQLTSASVLGTNGWHHVAVTLADNRGVLYLDGIPVATNGAMTLTPSILGNSTQNWLGRSQFGPDPYLDGRMDDFRIYKGALGAGDVATFVTPLATPTNVAASAGDSQVFLTWDAVAHAGCYQVRRSTAPGGPYSVVGSNVVGGAFIDACPVNSTTYYYVVSAANEVGVGADSAEVAATPVQAALTLRIGGLVPTCSGAVLNVSTVFGKTYCLEWADTLLSNVWTPVQSNIVGTGGPLSLVDSNGIFLPVGFYRFIFQP